MTDLAAQLRTIIENAKALRDVGVSTVTIGDVEFTLHRAEQEATTQATADPTQPKSALDDHASYGLPEGATLPGFRDPRKATP